MWRVKEGGGRREMPKPEMKEHTATSHQLRGVFLFFCFVLFCFVFRAASVVYGCSQARGEIGATAASLYHSHSNTELPLTYTRPHLPPPPSLPSQQRWLISDSQTGASTDPQQRSSKNQGERDKTCWEGDADLSPLWHTHYGQPSVPFLGS